jgi:hypothetical protein
VHIVRFIRALAAAVICAGAVLGFASPAQGQGDVKAPGVPEGVYNVYVEGEPPSTVEFFPICAPTVGDLREPLLLPVGCSLKATPNGQPGAIALMTDGQWRYEYNTIDGRTCPDGTKVPQRTIYAFDPYTLVGTKQIIHGGECGDAAAMVKIPMTLTFNRPPPIPVDQYPLICEPGGLRRCF